MKIMRKQLQRKPAKNAARHFGTINANTAGRNMKLEKTGGDMNFLKLHNTYGAEVSVNLALVQVIEPYEYGKAKVTKLFFAQSVYDVLETPEEIFGMNLGRIKDIPKSVVYARKNLLQAEIGPNPETWYPDMRR